MSVSKILSIQKFDNSLLINLLTTILPNGNTFSYHKIPVTEITMQRLTYLKQQTDTNKEGIKVVHEKNIE